MPDALDNDTPAQWSAQFPSSKEEAVSPDAEGFQDVTSLAQKLLATGKLPEWQTYLLRQLVRGWKFHVAKPLLDGAQD